MGAPKKGKKAGASASEQPPQQTMQLIDAAALDAKINAIRGAWTEVEIRRLKRKEELKALGDRITATSDQLASMCRNDRVESLELFVDTCRTLQLKIDKLEDERVKCAERWKTKLEEAEEVFRNNLFGEQLPLLLAAGKDDGEPSPIVDAPPGAPQQVVALTLGDNRMLRVGGRVMIHGAGAHRPGVVLELEDNGSDKKHGALVRYDGDDPTPAHVMAHQCHPLDGLEGEPAKGKRGKRARKDAAHDSEADAIAGELDVDEHAPDVAADRLAKGRTPKPLALGDRVVMIDDTSEMSDSIGTIEALTGEDHKGRMASVRWDLHDDRLHDVYVLHLRRSTKKDEGELAPHYEAAKMRASESPARELGHEDDGEGELIDAAFDEGPPPDVAVTPIASGRKKKPSAKKLPDDVA